jgi:hypothetical protein
MTKKPNYFQKRWDWHCRVIDFEKKFQARPQQPRPLTPTPRTVPTEPPLHQPRQRPIPNDTDAYNNRLRLSTVITGNKKTYVVTLKLDNDDELYDDVEETRVFETEEEAQQCLHALTPLQHIFPLSLLKEFQSCIYSRSLIEEFQTC